MAGKQYLQDVENKVYKLECRTNSTWYLL